MKILFEFISYFFKYEHFKLDILFCRAPCSLDNQNDASAAVANTRVSAANMFFFTIWRIHFDYFIFSDNLSFLLIKNIYKGTVSIIKVVIGGLSASNKRTLFS